MNDGGPAFPLPHDSEFFEGLSLRDWFAGQALAGLVVGNGDPSISGCAEIAYELSDAMLKEREKRRDDD